ncbi:MAG TPA: hypothetical protein PK156_28380 [Polyangium sp.]|nr:hypothetical protein [Polyangium sp.]
MTARSRSVTKQQSRQFAGEPRIGLRLHPAGERIRNLLDERERLLRTIGAKKVELDEYIEKARADAKAMFDKVAPFMERFHTASAKLQGLFDELLTPGRLSANARKKVGQVRRRLEREGLLEPIDDPTNDTTNGAPFDDDVPFGPFGAAHADEHAHQDVESAAPRGQNAGHESLRALFKRLALAMHPDHAAHDHDRERRTEAMKQVTRAYEQGDLASLLELEKMWQQEGTLAANGDDEARCRELERTIAELRAQITHLDREMREARKLAPPPFVVRRIDMAVAQAKNEVAELETVCQFVESFRDGKISLTAFVRGPTIELEVEEVDLQALAMHLFDEMTGFGSEHPSRSRRKRR